MELETVVDRVAAHLISEGKLPAEYPPGHGRIWALSDLAVGSRVSLFLLGRVRKHFKRALAQALTPGKDSLYEVRESTFHGRAAITILRLGGTNQ